MSALRTSPTRGDTSATTSTARFTTAITSSHSPSMLVNIALVSWEPGLADDADGRRDRLGDAAGLSPVGEMVKATIMRP